MLESSDSVHFSMESSGILKQFRPGVENVRLCWFKRFALLWGGFLGRLVLNKLNFSTVDVWFGPPGT